MASTWARIKEAACSAGLAFTLACGGTSVESKEAPAESAAQHMQAKDYSSVLENNVFLGYGVPEGDEYAKEVPVFAQAGHPTGIMMLYVDTKLTQDEMDSARHVNDLNAEAFYLYAERAQILNSAMKAAHLYGIDELRFDEEKRSAESDFNDVRAKLQAALEHLDTDSANLVGKLLAQEADTAQRQDDLGDLQTVLKGKLAEIDSPHYRGADGQSDKMTSVDQADGVNIRQSLVALGLVPK